MRTRRRQFILLVGLFLLVGAAVVGWVLVSTNTKVRWTADAQCIHRGMTHDEVVAKFGAPGSVANVGIELASVNAMPGNGPVSFVISGLGSTETWSVIDGWITVNFDDAARVNHITSSAVPSITEWRWHLLFE